MKNLLVVLFVLTFSVFTLANPAKADTGSGQYFNVIKTASPGTAGKLADVTFAITLENTSASNQAPEKVIDTLPDGWTYNNDAKLTDLDTNTAEFAPTVLGQELTWTFDGTSLISIPPGENIVISFTAKSPNVTGSFVNEACLEDPESVCATATVTVQAGTPQAGLTENIVLLSGISAVLIVGSLFIKRDRRSFEEKIIDRI